MLQLVDQLDRLSREDLDGVLIGQVVASFYGVEHVPFPRVALRIDVAECGTYAPLCRTSVGPDRMQLTDHRGAQTVLAGEVHGSGEPRATAAYHDGVVLVKLHPWWHYVGTWKVTMT